MGLLMMVSGSKLLTTRSKLVTDHQNYLNQKAPNTHAEQTLPQGPAGKETEGSHYGSGSVRRCVSSLCPRSAALWSSERAPVLEGRSQHTERFSEGCHFKHVLYSKMQNSSECQNKQAIQKKKQTCVKRLLLQNATPSALRKGLSDTSTLLSLEAGAHGGDSGVH